jgi:hypothetical protein
MASKKTRTRKAGPEPIALSNKTSSNLPNCTCDQCRSDLYPNEFPHGEDYPSHPERNTSTFRLEESRTETVFKLKDLARYESLGLANAVSAYLKSTNFTDRQRQAISAFKIWNSRHQNDDYMSITIPHLKYIAALFNEIFFWGTISLLDVRLSHDDDEATAWTIYASIPRVDHPEGYRNELPVPTIYINLASIKRDHENSNLTSKIRRSHFTYGILLHEMCHAFLTLYSCTGTLNGRDEYILDQKCPSPEECARLACVNFGRSGHGRAWFRLVKSIEDTCFDILGITMRLACLSDLISELCQTRGWMPSECDWNHFFRPLTRGHLEDVNNLRLPTKGQNGKAAVLPNLNADEKREAEAEAEKAFALEKAERIFDLTRKLNSLAQSPSSFCTNDDGDVMMRISVQVRINKLQRLLDRTRNSAISTDAVKKARLEKKKKLRNFRRLWVWAEIEDSIDIRSEIARKGDGKGCFEETEDSRDGPTHSQAEGVDRGMDSILENTDVDEETIPEKKSLGRTRLKSRNNPRPLERVK